MIVTKVNSEDFQTAQNRSIINSSGIIMGLLLAFLIITESCKSSGKNKSSSDGFVNIFDGKTMRDWEGDTTYWRVENGNLVGEITPARVLKNNSFIIWKGGTPSDFELTLECKITKAGNSGINYRSIQLTDVPHALKGYQADIDGANRYTGQSYEERGRTTLAYRGEIVTVNAPASSAALNDQVKNNAWLGRTVTGSLGNSDSLKNFIKSEDWNKIHLIVKGNRMKHYINNILMSDVSDNDTVNGKSSGLLGIQVHVGPPMKVEFRDIRLKKL